VLYVLCMLVVVVAKIIVCCEDHLSYNDFTAPVTILHLHCTISGGYMTQFADSFTFLTIRYAGHEVPAYQPQKALHMFNMYLDGTMFVK